MGFFDTVQLELFDFLGIPPRRRINAHKKDKVCKKAHNIPSHWVYEITRKPYKRGISFKVLNSGLLKINAPKILSVEQIFSEVLIHHDWVEVQLIKAKKIRERFPQKEWKSGEKIPFYGTDLNLNIQMTTTKRSQISFSNHEVDFFVPAHWMELSIKEQEKKMAKDFKKAFKTEFSLRLSAQVDLWSKKMGLYPKELRFKDTKTQWGSCSSEGVVCLNWKIGVFNKKVSDYVIVHELSHLTHQNHSHKFWNLVEDYIPNRKELIKELSFNGYKVDFLSRESELYDINPRLKA